MIETSYYKGIGGQDNQRVHGRQVKGGCKGDTYTHELGLDSSVCFEKLEVA